MPIHIIVFTRGRLYCVSIYIVRRRQQHEIQNVGAKIYRYESIKHLDIIEFTGPDGIIIYNTMFCDFDCFNFFLFVETSRNDTIE